MRHHKKKSRKSFDAFLRRSHYSRSECGENKFIAGEKNVNRAKGELTPGKSPGGFEGLEEENIRQLPPRGYGEFEKIKKSFVLLDFLFL